MTAFRPLPPRKAIEMVEAAGIPHAARLIRDQAAAGLIRSYALKIETYDCGGEPRCGRGDTMPLDLWRRIISEGVDDDVWTGGTVRLVASGFIGGPPAVNITEIGFNESDLHGMIDRQRGTTRAPKVIPKPTEAQIEKAVVVVAQPRTVRRQPDPSAMPEGALTVTIRQAGVALGFGRTKINDLMDAKLLERIDIDGSVRITTASIRAIARGAERA